ncbi:MAG: hypothetical protein RML37_10315, partial [Chitinophagales bacterium]|nr:hypothetical protein [Chitinophagales bacterium]
TGLAANFYFLDENKSGNCKVNGYFEDYPAKKLPYKQKLIIQHTGYITDTIEVLVDKEKVDIGTVKLGTIKRRLQVIVKDEDGNYLGDAPVEIVGVSVPCQELNNNSPPGSTCPLVKKTVKYLGTAYFAFENAGGLENNHQMYTIRVGSPEDANYEAIEFTTTIPYSSKVKSVTVTLSKATCLSGYVYAGKGNNSPVAGAKVKMDINLGMSNIKLGELETVTDANGYFMLKGVPMRSYPQVVRAMKSASNLIGDSVVIVTKPASQSPYYNYNGSSIQSQSYPNTVFSANISPGKSSSCITHDFHLTVYNDMDITNLMGFPMEVTALKPSSDNGAVIDGYFTSLPGNNQFKPAEGASLAFKQIKIIPSQTLKNDKGVPVAMPASVPVNTENNQLPLSLYGALNGLVEDKNLGIYIDKEVQGKQYGVIKGKVKLLATSFNQSVVSFDDAPFLALPGISNASKMIIPVLNADKSVSNPVNAPNGFKLCNSSGNPLKISLPGFPGKAISDYEATTYFKDEITLGVKLQTDIKDISPANLNLSLNNIKIKKGSNTSLSGNTAISFNLGNWKLTSNDFVLDQNGLKLNKGAIDAGITLPFTNILIKHDQLVTNAMQVQVSNLKLLGIHPVNVVSDNISFGLVQIPSGKKAWQVYVAPAPQVAANIQGLPAFGTADKIELSSIALQSNGEQRLTLRSTPVTLHNLLKFYPIDGSYISISPNQFLIPGSFNLKLHQTNSYSTTLAYEKNGNALQFNMVNTQMVTFNHPAALAHKFSVKPTLTDGKFTYSGYSEEPGVFPLTKTTLYYTNDSVSVWIDPGQNIPISNERKFSQAEGGMRLENGNWTTFWFSGAPEGMAGVSDVQVNGKKQRMKFTINGQVTAEGQSISVKNVETPFGNMSWVYDFPASRLTGHMNVNMDINSMKVQGQINSIVDGSGWFFGADGIVEVQGLGEINFAGMFGNYPKYPANVSLNLGDFKCLPSDFTGKVNGFLFQAGLKKQVVPEISFSVPALLDVRFGVDVGLTTRLWKSFNESGKTMGISLLAKGIAYAKGECEATCSSVNAAATAEVGISGIYNGTTGQYSITGCGSIGFTLAAEQCLGAAGICVDACVGVDIGEKNLGVNMIYNSNTGVDMGIQFTSCSSVCN